MPDGTLLSQELGALIVSVESSSDGGPALDFQVHNVPAEAFDAITQFDEHGAAGDAEWKVVKLTVPWELDFEVTYFKADRLSSVRL